MDEYLKHIETHFPIELKLLIHLTQNKPDTGFVQTSFSEINWEQFIQLVLKHRMVSHVLKNVGTNNVKLPEKLTSRLKEIKQNQSKIALSYSGWILNLNKLFEKDEVPHLFFKGPLLSIELYNDIGFRNFRDIDILTDKNHIEKAKNIIENQSFKSIYPSIPLSNIQKKVNYKISHHYHFKHKSEPIEIELHWNLTNPKSFFGLTTQEIISDSRFLNVANSELPYISNVNNLVFLATHGSIHQWYRLFWLKDFSMLLEKSKTENLKKAFILSKELKLHKCFIQACLLSQLIFNTELPEFIRQKINPSLIKTPLKSILLKDLSQRDIKGKFKFVYYRLQLKSDFRYYFELIYRFRTHLTDWEILRLPPSLFFLYYLLRPLLLIYKFMLRK